MKKKNDIKPKVIAKKILIPGTKRVQILFSKGLTSKEKSNLVALKISEHLELGHDVSILNSAHNGEIIGIQGDASHLKDILKYHDVTYGKD